MKSLSSKDIARKMCFEGFSLREVEEALYAAFRVEMTLVQDRIKQRHTAKYGKGSKNGSMGSKKEK